MRAGGNGGLVLGVGCWPRGLVQMRRVGKQCNGGKGRERYTSALLETGIWFN